MIKKKEKYKSKNGAIVKKKEKRQFKNQIIQNIKKT